MRISDWSSDVCSSDLVAEVPRGALFAEGPADRRRHPRLRHDRRRRPRPARPARRARPEADAGPLRRRLHGEDEDRKSVVQGKSGSERVDPGGRRTITTTRKWLHTYQQIAYGSI